MAIACDKITFPVIIVLVTLLYFVGDHYDKLVSGPRYQ